nr:MAG TPA: hypothetical protein [Caudoviricetes sp.]
MRKLILKIILFILIIVFLIITIMYLFRSDTPYLWFIGLIVSIVFIIFFPFEKFFKSK